MAITRYEQSFKVASNVCEFKFWLASQTNFGLEADEHGKLSLDKIYSVKYYLWNIVIYRFIAIMIVSIVSPVIILYCPGSMLINKNRYHCKLKFCLFCLFLFLFFEILFISIFS